jgi:N6-L-threonylcarbamoyladenine synthase
MPKRFAFPRPMKGEAGRISPFPASRRRCGRRRAAIAPLTDQDVADICASFQECRRRGRWRTASAALRPLPRALSRTNRPALVVAGGVAAKARSVQALQATLRYEAASASCAADGALHRQCGDDRLGRASNGWVSVLRPMTLDIAPRSRWPLDSGGAVIGSGGGEPRHEGNPQGHPLGPRAGGGRRDQHAPQQSAVSLPGDASSA